jgi:uncharacterized membrane protein YphA (DoxX/SURF4 family)
MELIIKIAIACAFGLAVVAKLTGKTKATFEKSYGLTFMYVIAFFETLFSIGLFTPFDWWSSLGLLVIMLGALATLYQQHSKPGNYSMAIVATTLLIVLLTTLTKNMI